MKIRSAVISFSDDEINKILTTLDLPAKVLVTCEDGKLVVKVKKGITVKVNIIFAADGRHLSATIDMGVLGNPLISRILKKAVESDSQLGLTLTNRTLLFDPQAAMKNSGIKGDFRVEKTAVGAGELVMVLEGEVPLEQFVGTTSKSTD